MRKKSFIKKVMQFKANGMYITKKRAVEMTEEVRRYKISYKQWFKEINFYYTKIAPQLKVITDDKKIIVKEVSYIGDDYFKIQTLNNKEITIMYS